jgi:hypothetical protein
MLACGAPGPLSVHTPDVCYGGIGFVQAEPAAKQQYRGVGVETPEFWKGTFTKPDAVIPVKQRLLWSWRSSNGWQASDNPRLNFASEPVLYKMYVSYELAGSDEKRADTVCTEFLGVLLPELEKRLTAHP